MPVISCACGARIRLPDDAGAKAFRCPKCKAEVTAALDARVLSSLRAQPGAPGAVCPICQSAMAAEELAVTCPDCDQVHHQACWQEIGGCSTYGCPQAPAATKETPATQPLTAWGDTKTCPACGETIKSIALRCRYCGTDFDTVDPLKAGDLRRGARRAENVQRLQTTTIVIFALSLIGCLAPLTLILGLAVLLPQRQLLAKAGPFYLVLGYSTVIVSVLYSVLMVLFLMSGMG